MDKIILNVDNNKNICVKLYGVTDNVQKKPLVIVLTGDGRKGSNSISWQTIPLMFEAVGIGTVIFDFEGLGESDGIYEKLTINKGITNIVDVLNFLRKQHNLSARKFGILGSSFGGHISVLSSQYFPDSSAMFLKSPVSFYPQTWVEEYGENEVTKWLSKQKSTIEFETEFFYDSIQFNAYREASKIKFPTKIIQGTDDEVVPYFQTFHLYNALSCPKEIQWLEGVKHGYKEKEALNIFEKSAQSWFASHLL